MLKLEDFKAAKKRVDEVIDETRLIHSEAFSNECGNDVYIKPENLQKTGAFKIRGAYNKIIKLDDDAKMKGLIASSAGNHAQGVAYAARKLGVKATICMPAHTPLIKVEATKAHGAEVVLHGEVYDEAYAKAVELQKKEGYTFIHPFDDEDVIAGQGTIGLEILDQLPDVEAVVVPVGGGGLISGIAYALKSLNPAIKVYGVQAQGAASMVTSLKEDEIVKLEEVGTIADGIKVKEPGVNTFDICKKYVDDIVTVSDDEVASAILALIEQHKLITEGAGAVSVAAVMFNKVPVKGKNVVCLLSGGNIDVTILSKVIERGLLKSGRSDTLMIQLEDKPGQLQGVSSTIAKYGANVTGVFYEKASEGSNITDCVLRINVETRNFDHIHSLREGLKLEGFKIIE